MNISPFLHEEFLDCFADPRVIEQFTHQRLPPDVNSAEQALRAGMIDGIVHHRDLKAALAN